MPDPGHAYALERPELSFRLMTGWLDRRSPIAPGAPRRGVLARAEPWTRPFGLPVGVARTGGSLAAMVGGRFMTRDRRRGAPCGG